jgi:hypothetical protein
MSRTHRPSRRARSGADPGVERLEALASVLLAGVVLERGDPPRLVRLRAGSDDLGPDELELGLLALDEGAHPLEALVGFDAPSDWAAIGVVTTGRATDLDSGRRFPTVSVQLTGRDGSWAATWRSLDGSHADAGACSGAAGAGPLPFGRIDDALRRALGLPTAPPPASTTLLWITQWLDAIVEAAAANDPVPRSRWPVAALVALHPVVAAFDLDPAALSLADFVAQGDKLAAWRDWAQLRQACAAGVWEHPELDPETAAWLDDGAFARWVLGACPELDELRNAVGVLLDPTVLAIVDAALSSWRVIEST